MTTFTITPDLAKKKAATSGRIACGEVVEVTIENAATLNSTSLYLRVIVGGMTIAQFPQPVEEGETADTWTVSGTTLKCNLNLNTVQAYRMICGESADTVFVLEETGDAEGQVPTLYFTKWQVVYGWPRRPDRDELYDMNVYPSLVEDMGVMKAWKITASSQIVTLQTGLANALVEIAKKADQSTTYTKSEVQSIVALATKPLTGVEFRLSNAGDVWDVVDFITKTLGGTVSGSVNPTATNPTITGVIPSADGGVHYMQAVYDGTNWTAVIDPQTGEE